MRIIFVDTLFWLALINRCHAKLKLSRHDQQACASRRKSIATGMSLWLSQQTLQAWMNANTQSETKRRPFKSVRGILQGEHPNLEKDIAEMRREAWRNFPREFPTEENK